MIPVVVTHIVVGIGVEIVLADGVVMPGSPGARDPGIVAIAATTLMTIARAAPAMARGMMVIAGDDQRRVRTPASASCTCAVLKCVTL